MLDAYTPEQVVAASIDGCTFSNNKAILGNCLDLNFSCYIDWP